LISQALTRAFHASMPLAAALASETERFVRELNYDPLRMTVLIELVQALTTAGAHDRARRVRTS